MALQVSAAEFLQFGLDIAGFDELCQQRTPVATKQPLQLPWTQWH
jgi:hypothetical protein